MSLHGVCRLGWTQTEGWVGFDSIGLHYPQGCAFAARGLIVQPPLKDMTRHMGQLDTIRPGLDSTSGAAPARAEGGARPADECLAPDEREKEGKGEGREEGRVRGQEGGRRELLPSSTSLNHSLAPLNTEVLLDILQAC